MSDHDDELEQVNRAANELIPQLTQRLKREGLGELEVRSGPLRVRVAVTSATAPEPVGGPRVLATSSSTGSGTPRSAPDVAAKPPGAHGVTSPAVGFFAYADGLGPGLSVEKGDPLGHVEMLGVRHDVRAPRGGTVRNLVTEAGEPVEYGQLLIELEARE
jgi:biotin carboxyl carrier protein